MSGGRVTLTGRWSRDALERRLRLEALKRREDLVVESGSWWRWLVPMFVIDRFLRATGLFGPGHRALMRLGVVENHIALAGLPDAFEGLRILHLSDLHLDLEPALAGVVGEALRGVAFDVCVATGDFRDRLSPGGGLGVDLSAELLWGLGAPVFACLGNHDLAEDVARLEQDGARVLVNESGFLERGGERLYFCGVDDPGYFGTDDFRMAFADVPAGACAVALAHDPGAFRKASECGAALMLCGHTHGGQMCLPGGFAPLTHSKCLRRMVSGAWEWHGMCGYTSAGVGASRVAARFFCRSQIAIHILHRSRE
jgi:uncharacterized protein